MYKSTIQQKNLESQESWMDDPFSLGAYWDSGVTINKDNETKLFDFVNELVVMYSKSNGCNYPIIVSDLSSSDKNELARLYIEYTDREIADCVNGNDFSINNEYTCALLSMLNNDCKETRDKFAEVVCVNIISFYEKSLNNLLAEACLAYEYSIHNDDESMYRPAQDDTGEYHFVQYK